MINLKIIKKEINMSKFSFISETLVVSGVLVTKIVSVKTQDDNLIVTLESNQNLELNLGPISGDTVIKEDLEVEIEPIVFPKNMFILSPKQTTAVVATPTSKKKADSSPNRSSPARGSVISNGWNL
jgi:hypothetical protein